MSPAVWLVWLCYPRLPSPWTPLPPPHPSSHPQVQEAVEGDGDIAVAAKRYQQSSGTVPDDLLCKIVQDRIARPDCKKQGWVLDGIPASRVRELL